MLQRLRLEWLEKRRVEILAGDVGVDDAPSLDVAHWGKEKLKGEQGFLEQGGRKEPADGGSHLCADSGADDNVCGHRVKSLPCEGLTLRVRGLERSQKKARMGKDIERLPIGPF
jgi:hypothetical protein